jgi:AcrR family transcriptional regulator
MARPRSSAAHQAALAATVELLFEVGVEGVTLEEVASRSGVARSTLYRHFGSKEALVVAAASCCLVQHPTPDTGSLERDLRFLFERFRQDEETKRVPQLLALLLDAAQRDPALGQLLESLIEERRRPLRTVLQLAQHRGEIGPGIDLDTALALIIGPFTHRRLIDRVEADDVFVETILTAAITGLRATAERGDASARPVA